MTVRNAMARLRSREGFTLIELLIVMVVLGILFTIGLFLFNDVRQSAENTQARAEIRAAYTQIKSHQVDNDTMAVDATNADGDIDLTLVAADGAAGTSVVGFCTTGGGDTHIPDADLDLADGEVGTCGTADTVFVGKQDAGGAVRYMTDDGSTVNSDNL